MLPKSFFVLLDSYSISSANQHQIIDMSQQRQQRREPFTDAERISEAIESASRREIYISNIPVQYPRGTWNEQAVRDLTSQRLREFLDVHAGMFGPIALVSVHRVPQHLSTTAAFVRYTNQRAHWYVINSLRQQTFDGSILHLAPSMRTIELLNAEKALHGAFVLQPDPIPPQLPLGIR